MPKNVEARPICPAAVQLPLFPDAASLVRVRPERIEWRFHRMEVWPDLFGRALLLRQWGRIGTEGGRRLELASRSRRRHRRTCPSCGTQTPPRLSGPRHVIKSPRKTPRRRAKPAPRPQVGMALHTADGARKYLTTGERDEFLRTAEHADRQVRTLCMTLAYAGCRLSEALALTADRVDLAAGVLLLESLKKRRSGIYRAVPVPPLLLEALDLVHGIRELQGRRGKGRGILLWPWSRMTGWRTIHAVMVASGLDGPHASPKGLRHAYGVAAVSAGIPLNLVQKWLGHAQLTTTAIYADAVGEEEQSIAARMW